MSLHTHYISVRPQVVVYWCSYGVEVSSNYVTNVIALAVDAESCIVTYLFRATRLFYSTEWNILHYTEQRLVQLHMRVTGDIGGSMGLLIGARVITLLEAVDAFAFTLADGGRRKCDYDDHRTRRRRMNS